MCADQARDEKKRYYIQADDTPALTREAAAFRKVKVDEAEGGIELGVSKG